VPRPRCNLKSVAQQSVQVQGAVAKRRRATGRSVSRSNVRISSAPPTSTVTTRSCRPRTRLGRCSKLPATRRRCDTPKDFYLDLNQHQRSVLEYVPRGAPGWQYTGGRHAENGGCRSECAPHHCIVTDLRSNPNTFRQCTSGAHERDRC